MTELKSKDALHIEPARDIVTRPEARIDVSAQLISLDAGLFEIRVVAPHVVQTEGGMILPCARIDPLPRQERCRVFFSSLAESELLVPSAVSAYLRVVGGRASVLLTTYKASGPTPPPEIHISAIAPASAVAEGAAMLDAGESASAGLGGLRLLVHFQNHGDLHFRGDGWAMAADGDSAIEGFSVSLSDEALAGSLEYQAILGNDWVSPWMSGGDFCGSRQMALPLLGVKMRLTEAAAASFRCRVWGRFSGEERGPFADGEACECNGEVLTGLRVSIQRREEA